MLVGIGAVAAVLIGGPSLFQSSLAQVNDVPDIMDEDLDSDVELGSGKDQDGDNHVERDRDSDDISVVVSQLGSLENEASD